MKKIFILGVSLLLSSLGFSAEYHPGQANPSKVRVIPVSPTPEPDHVMTTITFPEEGQIVSESPVNLQFRLLGFPVGTMSDFDRQSEIYNDPNGQSLLVFIDNEHPIEIYKSFVNSLDENNLYYDLPLITSIPYRLSLGMHVIRAFPDRSYGESLKGSGCYVAGVFYFREKKDNLNVDLTAPYLTYNEPLETLRYQHDKPILLDFYLSNTQLSRDGYKVKVIIDQTVERTLSQWVPYYIYGLERGTHTVRLQLLNEKNQIAPGLFNDVQRTITVD